MDFTKEKAWMVRQDGTAFACLCHIYGSSEDIEETLYAAQWLYEHTAFDRTKELCLSLFKAYGISLSERRNCVRSILIQIKQRHYRFLDYNFILDHAGDITGAEDGELTELNGHVNQSLNNEFMRVRYGGMYDSEDGNRDLYFRLSNDELLTSEWKSIICQIINEHENETDEIIVVSDEESTGECRRINL